MDNRTFAGLLAATPQADLRIIELTAELTRPDGSFDLDAAAARQKDVEMACAQAQDYAAATGRLPSHPDFERECYRSRLIPPRLAANCDGDGSFASTYDWSSEPSMIRDWIHRAFLRRRRQPDPDNSYPLFADNRHTDCSRGWQS